MSEVRFRDGAPRCEARRECRQRVLGLFDVPEVPLAPADLIASIRARSNALSLAAILETSTGGCCAARPAIMTDHSQPPVEFAKEQTTCSKSFTAKPTASPTTPTSKPAACY